MRSNKLASVRFLRYVLIEGEVGGVKSNDYIIIYTKKPIEPVTAMFANFLFTLGEFSADIEETNTFELTRGAG